MASSLEHELGRARTVTSAALETMKSELVTEEADIAESRVRYEAERLVDFYDELADKKVCNAIHSDEATQHIIPRKLAEEIVAMVTSFNTLEAAVGEATRKALQLTALPLDDTTHVSQYTTVLHHLGKRIEHLQAFSDIR